MDFLDLSLISKRIAEKTYYRTRAAFESDIRLMCENCRRYNGKGNIYSNAADSLEKSLNIILSSGMIPIPPHPTDDMQLWR